MPPPPQGGPARRFSGLSQLLAGEASLKDLLLRSPRRRRAEDAPTVTLQVGKQVFEGVDRSMRYELWMSSLARKGVGQQAAAAFEDMLLSSVGEEAAADIEKDLARTQPGTKRFASQEGQDALRRVLRAYAAWDPEVGYCQGLNFVAALLLTVLPERHAFAGLVVLMTDRGLRKYYDTSMELLQTHLWQLGRLMPPRLCAHLEAHGVLPLLYGASLVMDSILADRLSQSLLKAAVGCLTACQAQLLALHDLEDIVQLLKVELPSWDEGRLHDVLTEAFRLDWSPAALALLASTEGSESVADALARVQAQHGQAGSGAPEAGGAAGAAAARGTGGRSSWPGAAGVAASGSGSGGSGPGLLPPLMPPPPSPRRPSSAGSGAPTPRRPSSGGMQPASPAAAAAGAQARAVSAPPAADGSQQPQLPGLPPLRPAQQCAAAAAAPAAGRGAGKQCEADLIDLDSPKHSGQRSSVQAGADAAAPAAAVSTLPPGPGWDPWGGGDGVPQPAAADGCARAAAGEQQQASRQQACALSFTQLSVAPGSSSQLAEASGSAGPAARAAAAAEDEWGAFVASP